MHSSYSSPEFKSNVDLKQNFDDFNIEKDKKQSYFNFLLKTSKNDGHKNQRKDCK